LVFAFGASANGNDEISADKIQYADAVTKKSIEDEYFKYYARGVDQQKKDFGVNANDSLEKVQIGDGLPYYTLSHSYVLGDMKNISTFRGYIFPLKIQGIDKGVIFTSYDKLGDKLAIFSVSSETNYESDVKDAQKFLNKNETAKLIVDERFNLNSLVIENGSISPKFIPLKDNSTFEMKKHVDKSANEVSVKIKEVRDQNSSNKGLRGGFGLANNNTNTNKETPIVYGLLSVLALVSAGFIFYKNKKSKIVE
jgi:hypothetical protein